MHLRGLELQLQANCSCSSTVQLLYEQMMLVTLAKPLRITCLMDRTARASVTRLSRHLVALLSTLILLLSFCCYCNCTSGASYIDAFFIGIWIHKSTPAACYASRPTRPTVQCSWSHLGVGSPRRSRGPRLNSGSSVYWRKAPIWQTSCWAKCCLRLMTMSVDAIWSHGSRHVTCYILMTSLRCCLPRNFRPFLDNAEWLSRRWTSFMFNVTQNTTCVCIIKAFVLESSVFMKLYAAYSWILQMNEINCRKLLIKTQQFAIV